MALLRLPSEITLAEQQTVPLVMTNVKPFEAYEADEGSPKKRLSDLPLELRIVLRGTRLDEEWAGNMIMNSNCDDIIWMTMRVVPLDILLLSPVQFLWQTSDFGKPLSRTVLEAAC